jgi:glucose/mannose transport system substrate-binding protein
VINATVQNITDAQQQLRTRMIGGQPPDTFQVVGGGDLLQWVVYNGQDDTESKMESVDFLASANNWANLMPKPILDLVSYNGKMYGVPLALHRTNVLFYNKTLFDQYGLTPPTSWEEFYQVGDALKTHGIAPLAIGANVGFFVALLTFDNVLVAKAGADFRASYFAGHEDPADPRIVDTLNEVAKILDYTSSDTTQISWDQAAQEVVDGTAGMTIIGDWAKGYFLSEGMSPDVEFGQVPSPGTAGTFVCVVDAFGLPKGAPDRQAAVDFLTLVGSLDAQDAFNPIKGATPPRSDADLTKFDVLAQRTLHDFQVGTLTGSRQLLVANAAFNTELENTMRDFALDHNVDVVVNMLKNRYDEL